MVFIQTAVRNDIRVPKGPDIPFNFTPRINKWWSLGRILYAGIPHYLDLVDSVHKSGINLAKDRNLIVHGCLEGWGQPQTPEINIAKIERPGSNPPFTKYTIPLEAIEETSRNIKLLDDRVTEFMLNRMIGTHNYSDIEP